ncbi:MAG: dephospho-CoA kinase [Thermoflexaceae bacterium]|nr:dephospho-CoA kinase [Thermoflexaceae bacterium]
MKVIGITGGVGCGKSTVLELIEKNFNAFVIKADDVGKTVLDKGTAGYKNVMELFGEEILLDSGEIDRNRLADIDFHDKKKLMVLNSIVHPLVKKTIVEEMARIRCTDRYDFFIVEAALLLEDHYEVFCDEVWYIYADEKTRKRRLVESRGYSEEKIQGIMKNQLQEEEFRKRCDRIVDNSRTEGETLNQLKKMLVVD